MLCNCVHDYMTDTVNINASGVQQSSDLRMPLMLLPTLPHQQGHESLLLLHSGHAPAAALWVRRQQPQDGSHQQRQRPDAGAGRPLLCVQGVRRKHLPAKLDNDHLHTRDAGTLTAASNVQEGMVPCICLHGYLAHPGL